MEWCKREKKDFSRIRWNKSSYKKNNAGRFIPGELLFQLVLRWRQVQQLCDLTAVSVCLAGAVNQVGQPIGWDIV
ncbi:hypothetical protein C162_20581 [Paenibacillus sp. FSL R7-269]|nr:hypothetical protein C162_20581 [Paenibacillus sp. FSL R7-269]